MTTYAGARNPAWKGGRTITSHGYVLIRVGQGHPLADVRGYAYEHRLVAEQLTGRPLRSDEIIHHRDGNKQNNATENIAVMRSQAHHHALHRTRQREHPLRQPDEGNPSVQCACGCGPQFPRFDEARRPRRYVSGHNLRKA